MHYFFFDNAESVVRHRYQKMFIPHSGVLQHAPDGRMYLDFCNTTGTYGAFAELVKLTEMDVRRALQAVDARLCWEWLKQGGSASFTTLMLDTVTFQSASRRFYDSLTPALIRRLSPIKGLDTICMTTDEELAKLGFSEKDILFISDRLLRQGLSLNQTVVKL